MSQSTQARLTTEIINPLIQATHEAFEMMLGCQIRKQSMGLLTEATTESRVTARIELTGDAQGTILLGFPAKTACRIVQRLLDMDIPEPDEIAEDTVRELANVVGGSTKDKLSHLQLKLGLPQMVTDHLDSSHFPAGSFPMFLDYESELGAFQILFSFVHSIAEGGRSETAVAC